ncbi:MAG: Holliday junction branch migration protein RuvA [Pseudomonadota bacterium]
MIAYLRGSILEKKENSIILDVGGVGYEVFVPRLSMFNLPNIGEEVCLRIYTVVREDALLLYGFLSNTEKDAFIMLLKVSKIGPKVALSILSNISSQDLVNALISEDVTRLSMVQGVGKKTAERIIVELKGKISTYLEQMPHQISKEKEANSHLNDAIAALTTLGYRRSEVDKILSEIDISMATTTEDIIKSALRKTAK